MFLSPNQHANHGWYVTTRSRSLVCALATAETFDADDDRTTSMMVFDVPYRISEAAIQVLSER
jgi:hypothetical protein